MVISLKIAIKDLNFKLSFTLDHKAAFNFIIDFDQKNMIVCLPDNFIKQTDYFGLESVSNLKAIDK